MTSHTLSRALPIAAAMCLAPATAWAQGVGQALAVLLMFGLVGVLIKLGISLLVILSLVRVKPPHARWHQAIGALSALMDGAMVLAVLLAIQDETFGPLGASAILPLLLLGGTTAASWWAVVRSLQHRR